MISAKKVKQAARQEIRGCLSPLLVKALGRTYDTRDAIVISGFFRSGTTWLAELVSKSANAGIVFEPFHTDNVSSAKAAGFTYNNFRSPDENWEEGFRYVDNVLRGKMLNRWTASQIPVRQSVQMRRLVIKLVASNQMLVWLVNHFEVPTPVLLIRHPCAVLASWINRGWRLNNWIMRDERMLAFHPEVSEILDSLSVPEEFFAAKWCIDHYVPLSSAGERDFNIVPFEKMVVEGAEYLDTVLNYWNIEMPDFVRDEIRRPSDKASDQLSSDYSSAVGGWRNSLTDQQQQRVLRVVRDFGLDFYSSDVEPDYDRLFGLEPVRSR
ncbi:MAG: hypothetical protein AAFN50_11895 [Pseudomonadota bacterium]